MIPYVCCMNFFKNEVKDRLILILSMNHVKARFRDQFDKKSNDIPVSFELKILR